MTNWMKSGMGILGSVTAFAALPAQAAWYTYEYDASGLPTAATPAWTQMFTANNNAGNSDFTATAGLVNTGFLRIESTSTQRPHYSLSGTAWNIDSDASADDAFTIDLRLRVVDNTGFANGFQMLAGDTSKRAIFSANTTAVTLGGASVNGSANGFDPTQYNVYRITGTETSEGAWSYSLYINDDADPFATYTGNSGSASSHVVLWGDTSATAGNVGGTFEIDYIRWNNTQAVAVPEPTVSALTALCVAGLACRRRRPTA